MLAQKLMGSAGGASDKLYVDDVFSTYLYTGNGSTQTINNGIDLAGKGGLVWIKNRPSASASNDHCLVSGDSGANSWPLLTHLKSNKSDGKFITGTAVDKFTSSGFNIASAAYGLNENGINYASWTFRKAPKFFDVVTYTGNGVAGRQIPHALGIAPGMVIVKRTDSADDWIVYHRSMSSVNNVIFLNSTSAEFGPYSCWNSTAPTPTEFTLGIRSGVNASGATYVAYLFAHDPSADGIIQCGSFTTDASGNATVNLGWEPQWVMVKKTSAGDEANAGFWWMQDSMRGYPVWPTVSPYLHANTANAEDLSAGGFLTFPTATGFAFNQSYSGSLNSNFIYLAIRRPNKPPTTGTEVYNAIARKGTSAAATVTGAGFAPDLVIVNQRTNVPFARPWFDRLRGSTKILRTNGTNAEQGYAESVKAFENDGILIGTDAGGFGTNNVNNTYINHFFKRAPGFFDVVCTNDNGSNQTLNQTLNHSLGVAPELIIEKQRSSGTDWWVQLHAINARAKLNLTDAAFGNLSADPVTATTFKTAGYSSGTSVAYLFASVPGISKVGSYTGNGTTLTINCGFTTGARFILVKRTDATGDWHVWDTARGIVSANDPHLSLNTTAAEVTTDDSVDPANSGFIVNQVAATNINVTGGSYIFLAIS